MEFGDPQLRVREPLPNLPTRSVTVAGAWHLWIYCCSWSIRLNGETLATSTSSERKAKVAIAHLDGQALVHTSVDAARGRTVFDFDLGGSLVTRRYDREGEQWLLFEPFGHVLKVRADGQYAYQRGDTPPKDARWLPLETQRR